MAVDLSKDTQLYIDTISKFNTLRLLLSRIRFSKGANNDLSSLKLEDLLPGVSGAEEKSSTSSSLIYQV
ncbi:hypothetical protein O3M35_003361 [Rhynocoris fuscipes]|uniref:Uncharacterized protein n=1 Tax=Rhynocoris fuscipes TaxID=488301 RepID=A0AAW1CRC1_9HEMI